MYTWRQNEEITAGKLNAMQTRPQMEAINKAGLGIGGLDDSALSSDVIDSDGGTWSTVIPQQVIITEHEVGNLKYEYDAGSEGWKLRSGRAGVTGKPQVAAGELKWLCKSQLPSDAKQYLYQKINTDSYGNPITASMCVKTNASMGSNTWDPATGTTGTIWRRMASIEPDTDISSEPSCKKSWAMKAINENNAFMLPIARRYGSLQGWENIKLKEATDVKDRGSSSHWAPVMFGEVGMSNLIQSIGELGGTFVYQTKEGCGSSNDYGIGIASGIEFYDDISIKECYNCHEMRPKSTRACAPLGPGGKYGKIIIQNVNPKHPWQFQLTADLDIGSIDPGSFDPGSQWWECQIDKMPMANGPVSSGQYYDWGGRQSYPEPYPLQKGIMDGSVTRLTNQDSLWCGMYDDRCSMYRVGEIKCGGVGIGTASFWWNSEYDKSNPFYGTVALNRNGGVVTGISNDSTCRPTIDRDGWIHLPNPEWMGKYGVKIPCANNRIIADGGYELLIPQNDVNPDFYWANELYTQAECYKNGTVNGKIINSRLLSTAQGIFFDDMNRPAISNKLGDVADGTIRIPSSMAMYAPGEWDPEVDTPSFNLQNLNCDLTGEWTPGGGVIRGIQSDIPMIELICNATCGVKHHYVPEIVPYIDENGVIHLPSLAFTLTCPPRSAFVNGPITRIWTEDCGLFDNRRPGVPSYLPVSDGLGLGSDL